LGTSTAKEFKEYFEHKKIVTFSHTGDESKNAIDMVFNKKRADDRKKWLENYNRELYVDTNHETITYSDFINKEMIHFSKYDCDRSIPNVMDGLKISLRKILYAAFKKRLTTEIKVAQFSGYVSEQAAYHHGEQSLNEAIVGLAQNFVGSNNINLFEPCGQFGTRLQGGKDSASERYIYTHLNRLTRYIFPESDDKILKYLDDDGFPVEPLYYVPIIPMILVNGSRGIGTGFSTNIMCYNVNDIIQYIQNKIDNTVENIKLRPYYQGFNGTITEMENGKYLIKGVYEVTGINTIKVTELPVGYWTDDFKEHLEELILGPQKDNGAGAGAGDKAGNGNEKSTKKKGGLIKDYSDMSTDIVVDFTITFNNGVLQELLNTTESNGCNALEKLLKLYNVQSTNNMHAFDSQDKLKKYETPEEMIDDFYEIRLEFYDKRKIYQIEQLTNELIILSNKARYIQEILDDSLDLRKKKQREIIEILENKGYSKLNDDNDYKYLIKMPMDSVSEENVEKIMNEKENKETELNILKSKDIKDIWSEELQRLNTEYLSFVNHSNGTGGGQHANAKKVNKSKSTKSKSGKKMSLVLDDE